MDYESEIKVLQAAIKELKQMKEFLYAVEDAAVTIENDLCDIDKVLPLDDELKAITDPVRREQASHAVDLLKEAFSLMDEILGPPDDEITGDPVGTAYMPEARGNCGERTISLDDILARMKENSKNHLS